MSFRRGQRVRVKAKPHAGHHRTPAYVKGQTGRVERVHGLFSSPEERAYGGAGLPGEVVYMVSFSQRQLWPDYRGKPRDRVCVDLIGAWLEDVD